MKYFWARNSSLSMLFFLLFFTGIFLLQNYALKENLRYGFRDGDWWILFHFKTFGNSILEHLVNTWREHTVYSYQVYYSGVLVNLLGLNFPSLYQANHFFKYLATLSIFPLVYLLSKNKLAAVLATIIFAVSYSSIGALYMFITGGYYVAIIFMSIFYYMYCSAIRGIKSNLWLFSTSIVLVITILLNTERMYPLIPSIVLIELFLVWKNGWSKISQATSLQRIFIILLPFIVFSFLYIAYSLFIKGHDNSVAFIPGFLNEAKQRTISIQNGNWQLLLYPFASLGSLFFYGDYWKLFGVLNFSSFSNFVTYLITRPLLILLLPTFLMMLFISGKPKKWTSIILGLEALFYILGFWIYKNWQFMDKNVRIHFDPNLILAPAAFGFYILVLNICILLQWNSKKVGHTLLPMIFIGPLLGFLFIFLTWIYSDVQLIFMGPQRYLTVPSIGSSMFIAGVITLFFYNLKTYFLTKNISSLILLVIIPIIIMNIKISKDFFNYELIYVGMDGVEQTRMKNEFWSFVPNMSNTEGSLFYFDETADKENGYFNESTIIAGLDSWVLFDQGKDAIKGRPEPGILRTNVQCPEHTHQSCLKMLANGLRVMNGQRGILYADSIRYPTNPRFYRLENFYAFRFVDKHLINIKDEILKELDIN